MKIALTDTFDASRFQRKANSKSILVIVAGAGSSCYKPVNKRIFLLLGKQLLCSVLIQLQGIENSGLVFFIQFSVLKPLGLHPRPCKVLQFSFQS